MLRFLKQWKLIYEEFDRLKTESYYYGLELAVISCLIWGSILVLAIIVGNYFETIFFFIAFLIIRKIVGGYHASTIMRCYILSISTYGIFSVSLRIIPEELYLSLNFILICFTSVAVYRNVLMSEYEENNLEYAKAGNRKLILNVSIVQQIITGALSIFYPYNQFVFSFCLGSAVAALTTVIARENIKVSGENKKYREIITLHYVKSTKLLCAVSALCLVISIHSACNGPYFEPMIPDDYWQLKARIDKGDRDMKEK